MKLRELLELCDRTVSVTVQDNVSGAIFARFDDATMVPNTQYGVILDRPILRISQEGRTLNVVITRN